MSNKYDVLAARIRAGTVSMDDRRQVLDIIAESYNKDAEIARLKALIAAARQSIAATIDELREELTGAAIEYDRALLAKLEAVK